MGHMVAGLVVDTGRIDLTPFEMEYFWTLQRGEGIDIGMILVLIQIHTMIVMSIILIGGVIGGIFQMNLGKKSHLLSTGK